MNRYSQYLKWPMYQGHHHHPSTYIIYPLFCLSCIWGSFASSNDLVIPVPATGHCSVGHCSSQDEHQPPAQCVAVVQWGQTLHVLAPLLPQPGGTGAGLLETSAAAADGQPGQVHADHGSPGGWVVLLWLLYTLSTMDLEYNNKLQSCSWGIKTSNLDSDEPNSAMKLWRKYKISNIIIHVNIPHDIPGVPKRLVNFSGL